ncbi:MAG: hypothetical protein A2945_03845 [Candidatus Liptonbacteria bacterium RIFCSPLOWO2_01_FULL_52_25]|uniref:Uncharacterized protein n=1 Tax=Candidatus Liptonbacteria bacterium RIFCSPLOWO2_01_FULL_52_25 TaxID=1798650 RepID=A0A1G2CGU3_9BACT|nr:MAG: hypothetical protein A2945_03845 [Candidatus Liptonbacteria bacterium RIFCSPLOWO2_01_FULL_52_25]
MREVTIMKISVTPTGTKVRGEPTANWEIHPESREEREHFEKVHEIVKKDMPNLEISRGGTLRFAMALGEMKKLKRILEH